MCHHVSRWNSSLFYISFVTEKMTICRGVFIYISLCKTKNIVNSCERLPFGFELRHDEKWIYHSSLLFILHSGRLVPWWAEEEIYENCFFPHCCNWMELHASIGWKEKKFPFYNAISLFSIECIAPSHGPSTLSFVITCKCSSSKNCQRKVCSTVKTTQMELKLFSINCSAPPSLRFELLPRIHQTLSINIAHFSSIFAARRVLPSFSLPKTFSMLLAVPCVGILNIFLLYDRST